MGRLLSLWLLLSLAARALPLEVEQALRQPGPVEFLSLYPQSTPLRPGPTSGGFLILGRAHLPPKEAASVCQAVLKGIEEGEQRHEKLPSCFEPRHALRVGELDVVICYSCHRWNAYQHDVEIGAGVITDRGSKECDRAVIERGLQWQGWVEMDNRFLHASGFSIALPPYLKAGRRAKDEVLHLGISFGNAVFHFPRKTGGWFTHGEAFSFDSPAPLAELRENLHRRIPGTVGELDLASNQLEVFGSEADLLPVILNLLSPEHPEGVYFLASLDATVARTYLNEAKAELESKAPLKESSPGLWTGVSQGRFQAVTILQREGCYLVCRAEFATDESIGRQRLDELLTSVRFRAQPRYENLINLR